MKRLASWTQIRANCFSRWMLAGAAMFTVVASAQAQGLVQYEFTGVVTDNSGNLGVFGPLGGVDINDVFTGRFSYMTGPGNPDQQSADTHLGAYNLVDFDIDQAFVTFMPFGIAVRHLPPLPTLPPLPLDLGTDGFTVVGTFTLGMDTRPVSLRLEAPYETVFTDDSLPTSLTLSDFTDTAVVRSIRVLGLEPGTSQIDEGRLTSLVLIPEPSSGFLALLLLTAAGPMCVMWRRHARRWNT